MKPTHFRSARVTQARPRTDNKLYVIPTSAIQTITISPAPKKLADLFNENFETYASSASAEVKAAAPKA